MKVSLEQLIGLIFSEVLKELKRQGVKIDNDLKQINSDPKIPCQVKTIKFDFSGYKTPVLTEGKLLEALKNEINEIVLPRGTVITPGARQIIKKQAIVIKSELKR